MKLSQLLPTYEFSNISDASFVKIQLFSDILFLPLKTKSNRFSNFIIQKNKFTFNLIFSNYSQVVDEMFRKINSFSEMMQNLKFSIEVMLDDKKLGEILFRNIKCTRSISIDDSLKTLSLQC
jgi:hypothetical protein